jgi:hypothetical protein
MLSYRLPRVPSAPRLAVWRAIRRLGAQQLGDGLVALPRSARNLEHLQWLAAEIVESGGTSTVWHARPDLIRDHEALAAGMLAAVDAEYEAVMIEAETALHQKLASAETRRTVRRLRGQLRRIGQRDHFGARTASSARAAVDALARSLEVVPV